MMFATGTYITYITLLHRIITIFVHHRISSFEMALVIPDAGRCLMVHHQFYTFGMGVIIEIFEVEIRIGGHKIKNIVLLVSEPILPSYVPAFHKHFAETVFSRKVNIIFDMRRSSTMAPVRLHRIVVGHTEFHAGNSIGVTPGTLSCNHFPPDSYIFCRMNPTGIFNLRRLVEVKRHAAC